MSSVYDDTSTITSVISSVTVISTAATATVTETATSTITDAATSSDERKRHAMPIEPSTTEAVPEALSTQTHAPKLSSPLFTLELRSVRTLDPLADLLAARGVLVRRTIYTQTEWEYETTTSDWTTTYTSTDWWSTDWHYEYEYVTDLETSYDSAETTVTSMTTVTTHVPADDHHHQQQQQPSTLSTGSIAGIAVGGAGGLAILAAALWWWFFSARRRRRDAPEIGGAEYYEDQAARADPSDGGGGGGFGGKPPAMAMAMAMESSDAIPAEVRPMMGTGPISGYQGLHAPAPWKHESSPPPPFRSLDTSSLAPQHPGSTYISLTQYGDHARPYTASYAGSP